MAQVQQQQPVAPIVATTNLRPMRAEIEQILQQITDSKLWQFQEQVEVKARRHLRNLIYDHYLACSTNKKTEKKSRKEVIESFHNEMFTQYRRWCHVASQKVIPAEQVFAQYPSPEHYKVAEMLLIVCIWGEIDILRSQNNIIHLLFQACKMNYKQQPQVANLVRREAIFMYQLLRQVGFNRTLRNEYFISWEDVNVVCWTPGFVAQFLKEVSYQKAFMLADDSMLVKTIKKEAAKLNETPKPQPVKTRAKELPPNVAQRIFKFVEPAQKNVFQRVCKNWYEPTRSNTEQIVLEEEIIIVPQPQQQEKPELKPPVAAVVATPAQANVPKPEDEKAKLDAERTAFVRKWKVYYDAAGGIQGWRGYLTMLTHFSAPAYVQLIMLSVMLYIFIEFPSFRSRPEFIAPIIGVPLLVLGLFFLFNMLILQWRFRPIRHPYKWTLPRRDTCIDRPSYKLNYLLWILIFLTQLVIIRYMVFYNLHSATKLVVYQLSQKQVSFLSIIALALSWFPLFFIFWTVSPIVFTVWKSIFGLIHALRTRVNRVTTWGGFKKHMRMPSTVAEFQKKCLGPENDHLKQEQVMYRFAIYFNMLIDDFYQDHMCSAVEKKRMSFVIDEIAEKAKSFDTGIEDQIRRITTVEPKCPEMQEHLIRWINNLYMAMPTESSIESMRRLVIMIPVYKESVIYSWKEIITMANTNSSFLQHLIKKFPHDWKCFKDKEFKYRELLSHVEQKVKAGVDLTGHYVPEELILKIRMWSSMRFQPVARTFHGFVKVPRILRLLLKLQTMHKNYSDKELDEIIQEKFAIVTGAQVLDKGTWRDGESMDTYVEDFMYLLKQYGDWVKIAYQKKVGSNWVGVLMKRNDQGEFQEEYRINAFGKFDVMGQGKPSHQAFMLQFMDGSIIQAIDCNQAAIMTQLSFYPNVLQEFVRNKRLKILGFPEYIFTENWSPAGFGAAFTEKVFGTMIQRCWALLGMRMHYGHPDFICGVWVMFTTGMSKMSYVSEDIFSGFDTLLNGGQICFIEYINVGKARDVCLFSTSKFNRKISGGAAQTACSQYLYEIMTSWHFNIGEKFTCFYTTTSHYINAVLIISSTFVLFFIRIVILTMRLFELDSLDDETSSVWKTVDYVFFLQLGTALSVPGMLQMILDYGLIQGLIEFFGKLKFLLISVYSVFHLLNTAVYFHYGFIDAAQYLASGRGAGLDHESIGKIVAAFDSSHFVPSIVLFLFGIIGLALGGSVQFFLYNLLMGAVWLWSPFYFNRGSFPVGVDYDTWAKLYAQDLDYVKKGKVKCIISELSKRTKNIKKIEENQEEEVVDEWDWIPDIKDLKTMEDDAVYKPLVDDPRDDKWFEHEKEKKFKNRWKYRFNRIRNQTRSFIWNAFLLITLTGIKYITLFVGILKILNPFSVPQANPRDMEHKANEKRFLQIQHLIKNLRTDTQAMIQQKLDQVEKKKMVTPAEASKSAPPTSTTSTMPKMLANLRARPLPTVPPPRTTKPASDSTTQT